MKKTIFLIFTLIFTTNLNTIDVYENYIEVYGEAPLGQHFIGFKTKTYTKEEAIIIAKNEIFEFLNGLVYGYNFKYKLENKTNNQKGYFELSSIAKIPQNDKNLFLLQCLEKLNGLKLLATYRLNDEQKSYIRAFNSTLSVFSIGEAYSPFNDEWESRLVAYKNAIKEAILNHAKIKLKARPLYIKGKIFLKESPSFSVVSGDWKCVVKVHLMITEIKYEDVF